LRALEQIDPEQITRQDLVDFAHYICVVDQFQTTIPNVASGIRDKTKKDNS